MANRSTIVGVFEDRQRAQQAVQELKRSGFSDDQIGVATRDEGRRTGQAEGEGDLTGTFAEEGAAAGMAAGAGLGALWGLGILAGALPAIGPAIAGGTLGIILSSAGAGALAAGLGGALIGMGVSQDEAEYYEGEFKSGRTIVSVTGDGRSDEAAAILRRFGAYDLSTRGAERETTAPTAMSEGQARETAWTGAEGQRTMELREEQLDVHKRPVETGEVAMRKEVHTEQQSIEVPVSREEVVIERTPVEGGQVSSGDIREGEEVRIPVSEEQVDVEKHPVVKEEVRLGKRQKQDTQRVDETVRKEDVRVENEGDVNVRRE